MKVYLAGGEAKQWLDAIGQSRHGRALFSYYYFEKNDAEFQRMALERCPDIFIDSGGFSASTQGHKIDLKRYGRWVKAHQGQITTYANLDVIGDHRATAANQKRLEAMGLSPVPVFHVGSPFKELNRLVRLHDYIALGGMVPFASRKKDLSRWLSSCFTIIKDRAKVHGFGLTSLGLMKRYPFYSVDSTAWLAGTKFGKVMEFKRGRFATFSESEDRPVTARQRQLMDRGEGESRDKRYFDRCVANASEWTKAERYLTKLWNKRGLSWE